MPKIVYAHMLAYQPSYVVRPIVLPDAAVLDTPENLRGLAYELGQNDFQNVPGIYSVSAGDVLDIGDGELWLVCRVGFRAMTFKEFDEYKALPRQDRVFSKFME
jgi:hypothetical protein